MAKTHSDIGLIGLAVMGQNLALNIADHGFQISVYNRTTEKTEKFVTENPSTPGGLFGAKTLEEFGVPHDVHVLSAHRSPHQVQRYVTQGSARGIKVFIAAAGGDQDFWF